MGWRLGADTAGSGCATFEPPGAWAARYFLMWVGWAYFIVVCFAALAASEQFVVPPVLATK